VVQVTSRGRFPHWRGESIAVGYAAFRVFRGGDWGADGVFGALRTAEPTSTLICVLRDRRCAVLRVGVGYCRGRWCAVRCALRLWNAHRLHSHRLRYLSWLPKLCSLRLRIGKHRHAPLLHRLRLLGCRSGWKAVWDHELTRGRHGERLHALGLERLLLLRSPAHIPAKSNGLLLMGVPKCR
jgi:hypothetical protein